MYASEVQEALHETPVRHASGPVSPFQKIQIQPAWLKHGREAVMPHRDAMQCVQGMGKLQMVSWIRVSCPVAPIPPSVLPHIFSGVLGSFDGASRACRMRRDGIRPLDGNAAFSSS